MISSDPFGAALERLRQQCPQISGAVLATGEGLILAVMYSYT